MASRRACSIGARQRSMTGRTRSSSFARVNLCTKCFGWFPLEARNGRFTSDSSAVENLSGWLTTVVARVCLDMLRARTSRREDALETSEPEAPADELEGAPALADAIGPALLIVLDLLTPAERVAFVLHDMFDFSFEEIAPIVDRTPAAARQLASGAQGDVEQSPIG